MTSLIRSIAVAAAFMPAAAFAFTPTLMSNPETKTTTTAPAEETVIEMVTTEGNIKILLYDDTPLHSANFKKLVSEGFYDGVLFHRVINDFMIQGGDPDSRKAAAGTQLGEGDVPYTVEAEFVYPKHFHKRGVLAAARQGDAVNPEKRSSGSQFYIVTGRTYTPSQLDQMEQRLRLSKQKEIFDSLAAQNRDTIMAMRRNRDQAGLQALQEKLVAESDTAVKALNIGFTPEQREAYTTVGGTPHLDGSYTVYGEVIEGMDVVDRIQKVATDSSDRPLEDVRIISMKVLGKPEGK